ncbi:MAG: hypothetical protein ACYSUV_21100, partial [Planctomycetota bacterium]
EVREAFHEYAYLASAVEIAAENLELVKHFEEVARTKYIAAAAGHPDVIRAQMELAKLEDQVKTLEDFRNPIVARLNAVLNRTGIELPWPHAEEFQPVELTREKVIAMLKTYNPELQGLDFEVESSRTRQWKGRRHPYVHNGPAHLAQKLQSSRASGPGERQKNAPTED